MDRVETVAAAASTLLGLAGPAGPAGIGASALMLQDKNDKALQMAIDADLEEVEKSITALMGSSSLAEVVL